MASGREQKRTISNTIISEEDSSAKRLLKQDNAPEVGELNQKQKQINQNIKIKTQIYDVSKQLDQITGKQEMRKQKYQIEGNEDEVVLKERKVDLKKEQLEIISLRNKVHAIKRQLQTVYNLKALNAKEDELKYLRSQLDQLQQEKKSLTKLKNQQNKGLKAMKSEEQYEDRIEELKKQVSALREESKNLNQKLQESERILRKNHQQYLQKQVKVKELEQKLLATQLKSKKRKPLQSVTPEMLEQLEQEVNSLQQARKEAQKVWYDKISAIDSELREKKMQEDKKLMMLKEKEKQLKLNELKIKELRKLIKCNMTDNYEQAGRELDGDLSQYKHRRNIKQYKD